MRVGKRYSFRRMGSARRTTDVYVRRQNLQDWLSPGINGKCFVVSGKAESNDLTQSLAERGTLAEVVYCRAKITKASSAEISGYSAIWFYDCRLSDVVSCINLSGIKDVKRIAVSLMTFKSGNDSELPVSWIRAMAQVGFRLNNILGGRSETIWQPDGECGEIDLLFFRED